MSARPERSYKKAPIFCDRSALTLGRSRRFRRACVFGWPSAFIFSPRHSPNTFGSARLSENVLLGQAKSTYYALSFEERAKEDRRAKNSGNRRCSRLKRYADKLAPALLDGASAAGSVSRFFAMRNCGALRAEQSIPTFRFTLLGMTTLSTDRRSALSHCEKSGRSGGDSASARSGCAQTA